MGVAVAAAVERKPVVPPVLVLDGAASWPPFTCAACFGAFWVVPKAGWLLGAGTGF